MDELPMKLLERLKRRRQHRMEHRPTSFEAR